MNILRKQATQIVTGLDEAIGRHFTPESEFRDEYRRKSEQVKAICLAARRDGKSGKILVSSLLGLLYETTGLGKSTSGERHDHANRLYNQWLREESVEEARGIASAEVCRLSNEPEFNPRAFVLWTGPQWQLWDELVTKSMKTAVAVVRCRFEAKTRPSSIHDDFTAFDLAFRFLQFLEERARSRITRAPRSKGGGNLGQFLPRDSRGADRGKDGRYEHDRFNAAVTTAVSSPKRKRKKSPPSV